MRYEIMRIIDLPDGRSQYAAMKAYVITIQGKDAAGEWTNTQEIEATSIVLAAMVGMESANAQNGECVEVRHKF